MISARTSCPDFLTRAKPKTSCTTLQKTRALCSASALRDQINVRDSTCVLSSQQALLHCRKPRPPTAASSTSNRCNLKTQHISPQRPIQRDYRAVENFEGSPFQGFSPDQEDSAFENMNATNFDRRSSMVSTPTEPASDPVCGFTLSQVVSELSCSKDLLCKMESLRHFAKKNDCRAPSPERRRSPLRRVLAKTESCPAESLTESLPVEGGLASPLIRYLPGCGLSAIRRTQVVRVLRLRDMYRDSLG
jgi:hypothetical protein